METARIREVGSLQIESANARHAVRYEHSPRQLVTESIGRLDIPHEQFTFVDFGAGKGRVLLLAASWPFKMVVGVEFAHELHKVALANI